MTFVEGQRAAQAELLALMARKAQVFVIHYSCESFYDPEGGRTPRITSIVCRNLGSGQTQSFSIHQVAELPSFAGFDPWEKYDTIEHKVLDNFFQFVREHNAHAFWCHWNMRDINYGFPAIEHRYEVLNGSPVKIPDERKYDLARILVAKYGKRYAGHPRLREIMKLNKITHRDFLSGEDEAKAFKDRNFLELHQSTLRKADVISSLLEMASFNRLKTDAPFWDREGGSIRLLWEKYVWTPGGKAITVLLAIMGLADWLTPDVREHVTSMFSRLWAIVVGGGS